MASEADAIPYNPALLRGERLLVLAPHPDDEVIGCGGLLAHHLRERRQVRVVVATDGGQAGDPAAREEETRRALALLGEVHVDFLGFPDRELRDHRAAVTDQLAAILRQWRPDLILAPSPVEFHPDHLELAVALCELVQRDPSLFAELAVTRVAFYEVGQPLRPNAIVDITSVAAAKYAAVAEHHSQLDFRDYVGFTRGLDTYRALTMPVDVKFAEAYFVIPLPELRTTSVGALQQAAGNARGVAEVTEEPLPMTVVVRTKDRPALLEEALASIRATNYPCQIVVVNDGGAPVHAEGVTLVEHPAPRGRSEAANTGVRMASNAYVAFLDDDDLFYPEHLATLARAAAGSPHGAWYSDAVSAFVRTGPSGTLETYSRLRLFAADFDRDMLLTDNFIPLPTVLMRRDDFLALGGFDPAFDLFEDWDFLIRLSGRGDFIHVPRVTCEIRHIENAGSITMTSGEGTPAFREAKLRVWRKHEALISPNVFANVLERRKKRLGELESAATEQSGLAGSRAVEVDRLQRESVYLQDEVREKQLHAARLEALVDELRRFEAELHRAETGSAQKSITIGLLEGEIAEVRGAFNEAQTTIPALFAEIRRLQGLLDVIYGSRTWKLHNLVQKVKGRG